IYRISFSFISRFIQFLLCNLTSIQNLRANHGPVATEVVRMKSCIRGKYGGKPALVAAAILSTTIVVDFTAVKAATDEPFPYMDGADVTRPPIGWIEFCASHAAECTTTPTTPRDVVLTPKAFSDLVRVNKWVNDTIKPMTDLEHWGVIEKWSYPDDGYGDCED